MTARPWRLAHRGIVVACGVLIDRRDDPDEAARRVLACWEPGCDVIELPGAWAVIWQRPRPRRAGSAEGELLVPLRRPDGAVLRSAIPLQDKEIQAIIAGGARDGDVVRARGGIAETFPLAGAPRVDPARWIDVGAVDLARAVIPLGDPPAAVVVQGAAPPPPWYDKGIGPQLAATLTQAAGAMSATQDVSARLPWWMRAIAWLRARLAAQTVAREARRVEQIADAPDGEADRALAPASAPSPGWWDRLQARVAGSLFGARLEKMLGERQAKYLQDVVSMFEEGRLQEALKRAIPLGANDPDASEAPLTWSIPSARKELAITLTPAATRTAASPPDMHDTLKDLYRRAAETLDREGRAEEAAFVLAELLRDPGAAVSLLERHGRFEAAASLADRARMDPALRVRQWMRADKRERAFALARRYRCYEPAATMLAKDHPDLADWLRAEHARHLARTGDLLAAVRGGQRVAALREEVLGWMDALIARGGPDGARMLPERVRADEGSFDDVRSRVLALCAGDAHRAERQVLADALLAGGAPSEALETLARPLVRALVRDAAVSGDADEARKVAQLAQRGADRALAVDLPRWPTFPRAALATQDTARAIDGADRGLRAVEDAVLLPDGRMLLAFGESGAELWSRAGRCVHRFDEPCARIVISDHGDRALALAPRGGAWRVASLSLDALRGAWWADLRLDAFADTFDGDGWVVAQEGRVLELDATDPVATALRALAVPGAGKAIETCALALARDAKTVVVLARHTDRERGDAHTALHAWDALSGRETASRALDTLGEPSPVPTRCAVDPATVSALRVDARPEGGWLLTRVARTDRRSWPLDEEPVSVARCGGWSCVLTRGESGLTATLWAVDTRCLRVELARATTGAARLDGRHLYLVDDLGRALVIELAHGRLARDLRV